MRNIFTCSGLATFVLVVTSAFSPLDSAAQVPSTKSEDPAPGRITERLICKNNSEQTYALYLPSSYSNARRWPLIAAFDPGARGNLPIEHFKEAAERYGFIVCGSNNSHNGPMPPTGEAAKAMLGDVVARFSIDDKRVYLAGFSGGARAATTLAMFFNGQIAGVIGCGAGFAEGLKVNSSLPFIYYGTVGTDDFNYPEMKQLDRTLEQARIVHHVAVFEGSHEWAPSETCVSAIEWIELQAMKSGRRARDNSFIDRLFATAQNRAIAYESSGRTFEAYQEYAAMAAGFNGLKDIAEAQTRIASLRDSKAVKQALARDRDQETEQQRRVNEIFGLRANAQKWSSDPSTQKPFLLDLKQILSDLKRKSEAKDNSAERSLARRVLHQYTAASFEQSMILIQTKKYDAAAANLAIDAEAMPDNWRVSYNLACAYALAGDKRRAIEALNNAVRKGFSNINELENNRQLDSLRGEPGFKKILDGLKK